MPRSLAVWGLMLALAAAGLSGCAKAAGGTGAAASYGPGTGADASPGLRMLEQGATSQLTQNREFVIRDANAWSTFYQSHRPDSAAPAVDFAREMVVGVLLTRNTGGYTVRLDSVTNEADRLVVHYTEQTPPLDAVVIQILTQPYAFAAVPRREGPVVFEHLVQTAPKR